MGGGKKNEWSLNQLRPTPKMSSAIRSNHMTLPFWRPTVVKYWQLPVIQRHTYQVLWACHKVGLSRASPGIRLSGSIISMGALTGQSQFLLSYYNRSPEASWGAFSLCSHRRSLWTWITTASILLTYHLSCDRLYSKHFTNINSTNSQKYPHGVGAMITSICKGGKLRQGN